MQLGKVAGRFYSVVVGMRVKGRLADIESNFRAAQSSRDAEIYSFIVMGILSQEIRNKVLRPQIIAIVCLGWRGWRESSKAPNEGARRRWG